MHLSRVDEIANNGNSLFHRVRPEPKVILAVVLLVSIITETNVLVLGGIIGFIGVLYYTAGISFVRIGHLAIYPAFFSTIFALVLSQGSLYVALVIIFRALGAALILIFLFCTTPYVDLFSFLSRFMPAMLGDIFLLTYRGLFILLDKCYNLYRSIRIRGGFRLSTLVIDIKNSASILGLLFINSFAMSERMYQVIALRGYDGYLPCTTYYEGWKKEDLFVIVLSIFIALGAVIKWLL